MRKVFIALFSILVISISVQAQSGTVPCPTLTLASPHSVTIPGETMTFSLKVEKITEDSKLEYVWTVSEGVIIEGLKTSAIKVATTSDLSGSKITVKVTVKGLSKNCANEAAETIQLAELIRCGLNFDN